MTASTIRIIATLGSMVPHVRVMRWRQIGLHHARHSTDPGKSGEVVRAPAMALGEVFERFDGDVDRDAFDRVRLDPLGEGGTREARHPEAQVLDPGTARLLGKGDPYLGGLLRREPVESQRRQQADHRARHTRRDRRERMPGRVGMAPRDVDPTGLAVHEALPGEAVETRS